MNQVGPLINRDLATFKRLVWALGERLLPRFSSSLMVMLLAMLTGPQAVGIFGWGTLALTALRSITDQAARQIALDAIQTVSGRSFVERYQKLVATVGPPVLAVAFWFAAGDGPTHVSAFLSLLPMTAIPVFYAWALPPIARLQLQNRWRILVFYQALSSAAALVVALPVLLAAGGLWGPSLQACVSELVFTALVWRADRNRFPTRGTPWRYSDFGAMAMYSALGWSQAQADRVLVGFAAGTSVLGQYSFGTALSRSLGDAVAAGTANVLRSRLAALPEPGNARAVRRASTEILVRSMLLTGCLALLTVCVAQFVLVHFLGPIWDDSLRMVSILTLSTIPANLTWSNATLQIRAGRGTFALLSPLAGIVVCVPVAAAAAHSLYLAGWVVLLREFVVVGVGFVTAGPYAPWKALSHCLWITSACALMVWLVTIQPG